MPTTRFLFWMFTIPNPSEHERPLEWPGVKYIIYQLEEAPTTKMRHYQGYVAMETQKSMTAMKKLNQRAHWEPRGGTHEEAKAYCSKADTRVPGEVPKEQGEEPKGQGARSDLSALRADLDNLMPIKTIAKEHFSSFIRYRTGILAYRSLQLPKRDWEMRVEVIWGAPGSGKTRESKRLAEESGKEVYWKDPGNKWFDDYQGEEIVVFDDFKCNWFQLSVLLRLLDRYPMKVELKGGSCEFQAHLIIITSQCHPREWYSGCTVQENAAIQRRLTNVTYLGEDPPITDPLLVGFHWAPERTLI